jgi:hypothetical protein
MVKGCRFSYRRLNRPMTREVTAHRQAPSETNRPPQTLGNIMELSAELFRKTINSLRGDVKPGVAGQRQSPRVGIRCRLRIITIVGGKPGPQVDVWARDVSRGGLGIVSPVPMNAGDRFVVRFPRLDGAGTQISVLCTVRNCSEIPQDAFLIGAMFEGRAIEELIAPAPAAAPAATH